MSKRLLVSPTLLGVGLLLLQGLTGCVTGSDLEKLNAGLTQRVEAVNSTVQAELKELQQELKAAHATQQQGQRDLAEALNAVRSESKAKFEELLAGGTTRAQTLKELRDETAEARKAVRDYAAQSVQDLSKITTVSAELKAELQNVGQAMRQTLLGTYQAEEAALRERLKVVTKVRQDLESASAKSGEKPASLHPSIP